MSCNHNNKTSDITRKLKNGYIIIKVNLNNFYNLIDIFYLF